MKVVIDTNVVISGVFFNGTPRKVLKMWFENRFSVACCEEILEEYEKTLIKLMAKYSHPSRIDEIISILVKNMEMIENVYHGRYSRDPKDDKFINCALSASAEYIISGDEDLLVLKKVGKINILPPSKFAEIIKHIAY